MDCDYNNYEGHEESIGDHLSCLYHNNENDRDYEENDKDYKDIKEEELQSYKDTFFTISERTFDGYKFHPHLLDVKQDQFNGYHYINSHVDDISSITHDDNIASIIIDVVNDACEHYKQNRRQYNMNCYD